MRVYEAEFQVEIVDDDTDVTPDMTPEEAIQSMANLKPGQTLYVEEAWGSVETRWVGECKVIVVGENMNDCKNFVQDRLGSDSMRQVSIHALRGGIIDVDKERGGDNEVRDIPENVEELPVADQMAMLSTSTLEGMRRDFYRFVDGSPSSGPVTPNHKQAEYIKAVQAELERRNK